MLVLEINLHKYPHVLIYEMGFVPQSLVQKGLEACCQFIIENNTEMNNNKTQI